MGLLAAGAVEVLPAEGVIGGRLAAVGPAAGEVSAGQEAVGGRVQVAGVVLVSSSGGAPSTPRTV